jgi:nucleoside-diphosphate kinase
MVAASMQQTLILFKPDCLAGRHMGNVLDRFERAGFTITACKMLRLTPEVLRAHYAHVADRPFYPQLEKFMASRPVVAMALRGDNVVQRVRDLLGPTDSRKAPKGTIRGDFGADATVNVVHASDTDANARIELARFFAPEELYNVRD